MHHMVACELKLIINANQFQESKFFPGLLINQRLRYSDLYGKCVGGALQRKGKSERASIVMKLYLISRPCMKLLTKTCSSSYMTII